MAKKHKGHYCKICGEYKSNESFSGKGHAQHICKECMSEMKKGNKKILDLPFGGNEFEWVAKIGFLIGDDLETCEVLYSALLNPKNADFKYKGSELGLIRKME